MDFGSVWSFAVDNYELLSTIGTLVGGSLVLKIKRAKKSGEHLITELKETYVKITVALADKELSQKEAEEIAEELRQDIIAAHQFANDASAILPAKFRKKIPLEFT